MRANPIGFDRVWSSPNLLCIVTRCHDRAAFIASHHRGCDETSLFVAATPARPVCTESPFSIVLADRTPILRGWCVVFDRWDDANNPFGRPGMRLGLHRLDRASTRVFEELNAARRAAGIGAPFAPPGASPVATPTPRARPKTITIPLRSPSDAPVERRPVDEVELEQARANDDVAFIIDALVD